MNVSKARVHKARISREKKHEIAVQKLAKKGMLVSLAVEYEMLNQRVKILQARMKKQLRPAIEQELSQRGIEDISGHKHIYYDEAELIHERHAKLVFNETAAEAILTKKGLLEAVSHEEIKRVMDEEKIIEAYEAGLLTPKEFDKMFSESVEWHFKVKIDPTKNQEYNDLLGFRKQIESGEAETVQPEIEVSNG